MRVELKTLMDKLGAGYVPGPYETCPWSYYEAERGITCSAEIRMGDAGDEIEVEIQMMYDDPPQGKLPMEQVFYMRCTPVGGPAEWGPVSMRIAGQPPEETVPNWEEKACLFFQLVVTELQTDNLPDIDELLDEAFHSRERFSDQVGGGGGKAPKIPGGTLLGMKKGGGGF